MTDTSYHIAGNGNRRCVGAPEGYDTESSIPMYSPHSLLYQKHFFLTLSEFGAIGMLSGSFTPS